MLPSIESNNILQMKTTFKKINLKNKLEVPILAMIINRQIIIITITRNLGIIERTIKSPPSTREDKYYLLLLWEESPQSI